MGICPKIGVLWIFEYAIECEKRLKFSSPPHHLSQFSPRDRETLNAIKPYTDIRVLYNLHVHQVATHDCSVREAPEVD